MAVAEAPALSFGDVVFLAYDEEEEPWHERILIAQIPDSQRWFVLTPDNDFYAEEISSPPLLG
eukprot:11226069-Lingulodinium_polyedra.AAC.1